ncbi:MAG: bifunctional phosphoribosylaminoimidazolecarboxamide formyltransferase/IMP cyclohydrolase [Phycisphaerae bacterium]
MPDLAPVRRAIVSVFDKTGLPELVKALHNEFGIELISTGGTASLLRQLGLPVVEIESVTGLPEIMDGRVKTLHPKVHGGILADRDKPAHLQALQTHDIQPIDLVVLNLYPFEKTAARDDATFEEAIEMIDIGGPAMLRAGAKNHAHVTVASDPSRYEAVLSELRQHHGRTSARFRLVQAQRAFAQVSQYDALVANFLATSIGVESTHTVLSLHKKQQLKYGENPHQKATLLISRRPAEASVAFAKQHCGDSLGYVNLLDADAALAAVKEFGRPAACIVKHATPCGLAVAESAGEAFLKAYDGDPLAAFGGIAAINREIDEEVAQAIVSIDKKLDVIVAAGFSNEAVEAITGRFKNIRLLSTGPITTVEQADANEYMLHKICGGYLMQERDLEHAAPEDWAITTNRPPTPEEVADLAFADRAVKHVKSNAVVICRDGRLVGVGGGQVDRVTACKLAVEKAGLKAAGAVAASDAFFPFPDGPQLLLDAGVKAIVQPGGSIKDQLTVDVCNKAEATMVFTGVRHFRH